MFDQLLKSISGPISTMAYTYPTNTGTGSPSVTPGGFFSKLLNVLSAGAFGGNTNNFLGAYTGMQTQNLNPASQAYVNSLNSYNGANASLKKSSKREAFAPGSVISSLQTPPVPQATMNPYQAAALMNPLQGFAGQAGISGGAIPGALTGAYGTAGASGSPYGLSPMMGYGATGGLGKLSILLMPVIGVISLVKSLFSLRGITNSGEPVQINKNNLDYLASLKNYQRTQDTDGSFDEAGYWDDTSVENENFDSSKLEM